MRRPKNYKWTKEMCKEEALKYNHKIDFKNNSKGAYPASLKNKWIDEICSHMIPLGNKHKRLIYRFIFSDNYCYVGLTYNSDKRRKCHLSNTNSSVYNHIKETNLIPIYQELTDYVDVEEAKNLEEHWKIKSEEEGYLILNKTKTGALGSDLIKWSKNNCQIEALKYKTRSEFKRKNVSSYGSSIKNGWLDEICSHMVSKYELYGHWNDKSICKEEALKYKTRYQYYLCSKGSFDSARRHGW